MNAPLQLVLSEEEAAAAVNLSPRTLRHARQRGELSFVKFGRRIGYTIEDLHSFIAKARQCPSPDAKAPRTGNTRSSPTVFDFEEARAARKSGKPKG